MLRRATLIACMLGGCIRVETVVEPAASNGALITFDVPVPEAVGALQRTGPGGGWPGLARRAGVGWERRRRAGFRPQLEDLGSSHRARARARPRARARRDHAAGHGPAAAHARARARDQPRVLRW